MTLLSLIRTNAADPDYAALENRAAHVRLKAYTGLRSSELRGLAWGDLDLKVGRVIVTRQVDHEERGERVPLKSETLTDRRTVPLMTELADELRNHRANGGVGEGEAGGRRSARAGPTAVLEHETLTPHSLRVHDAHARARHEDGVPPR